MNCTVFQAHRPMNIHLNMQVNEYISYLHIQYVLATRESISDIVGNLALVLGVVLSVCVSVCVCVTSHTHLIQLLFHPSLHVDLVVRDFPETLEILGHEEVEIKHTHVCFTILVWTKQLIPNQNLIFPNPNS
jgi:hypothetical protein